MPTAVRLGQLAVPGTVAPLAWQAIPRPDFAGCHQQARRAARGNAQRQVSATSCPQLESGNAPLRSGCSPAEVVRDLPTAVRLGQVAGRGTERPAACRSTSERPSTCNAPTRWGQHADLRPDAAGSARLRSVTMRVRLPPAGCPAGWSGRRLGVQPCPLLSERASAMSGVPELCLTQVGGVFLRLPMHRAFVVTCTFGHRSTSYCMNRASQVRVSHTPSRLMLSWVR